MALRIILLTVLRSFLKFVYHLTCSLFLTDSAPATGFTCNSKCRESRETKCRRNFHRCVWCPTFKPYWPREITKRNNWKTSTRLSSWFSHLVEKQRKNLVRAYARLHGSLMDMQDGMLCSWAIFESLFNHFKLVSWCIISLLLVNNPHTFLNVEIMP